MDLSKISKTIIYRPYSTLVTATVAYMVTGSFEAGAIIGSIDAIVKIFTYYVFDLFWDKITKKQYRTSLLLLTGMSSAGKTTIARSILKKLQSEGKSAMIIDGDEIRDVFKNTGFDKESRIKHGKDVGKMAVYLQSQGIIPIVSLIYPYAESRDYTRSISEDFVEIYVSTPLKICEQRDVKGLYKKARSGEIKDFTGISKNSPYETPVAPELTFDTSIESLDKIVKDILNHIKK